MVSVQPLKLFMGVSLVCVFVLADQFVPITIYWTTVEQFEGDLQAGFSELMAEAAQLHCQQNDCGPLTNGTLTVEIKKTKQARYDLNTTVAIHLESNSTVMLPADTTKMLLEKNRENITKYAKIQMTRIDEEKYGVKADDPSNWIISGIFIVLTLILLCVTVYLVKHKVNHVEEHYEEQKDLTGANAEA